MKNKKKKKKEMNRNTLVCNNAKGEKTNNLKEEANNEEDENEEHEEGDHVNKRNKKAKRTNLATPKASRRRQVSMLTNGSPTRNFHVSGSSTSQIGIPDADAEVLRAPQTPKSIGLNCRWHRR